MSKLLKSVAVVTIIMCIVTGCKSESLIENDIFANNPDPTYKNIEIIEPDPGTGSPQSYEELQDYLNPEKMNFFAFQILDVYSPEEAYEITGDDMFVRDLTTLFKSTLTYDFLNEKSVEIEINIAKAGTPKRQYEGSPLYEIGEEYAAYFTDLDFNDTWQVACPEMLFTLKSDGMREYALHSYACIDFSTATGTSLDLGVKDGEISVITSTENNPVRFVHQYDVIELAEFFREDWTSRGYSFKADEEKKEEMS
ncbi:MAG: hypothetical protein NC084_13760 [Bacteroides sp.]|nr:hypothetical protein [Eubacterium sp.]MCM1419753.1 hypothetical protein [Roseburia sp.]MCM1463763.1 hypothetical protein [Bacteroides sp.]